MISPVGLKVFKLDEGFLICFVFCFFKEWVFASKDKAEGCREGKVCEIGRHGSVWGVWERVSGSRLGGHSGWWMGRFKRRGWRGCRDWVLF